MFDGYQKRLCINSNYRENCSNNYKMIYANGSLRAAFACNVFLHQSSNVKLIWPIKPKLYDTKYVLCSVHGKLNKFGCIILPAIYMFSSCKVYSAGQFVSVFVYQER